MKILITGSAGLIGRGVASELVLQGHEVTGFDLSLPEGTRGRGDVRKKVHFDQVPDGIIHLAAISRVIDGERNPANCIATNIGGTQNLLRVALGAVPRPWVIIASSREVYGNVKDMSLVSESTKVSPVNVYGRSKVAAEEASARARTEGLRVAVVRFSNVYGGVSDHVDRVVPAFCHAAISGDPLRIEGPLNTFDFVYLGDVVDGVMRLSDYLADGGSPPTPFHFVSGIGTTLEELADLVRTLSKSKSIVETYAARGFDVSRFVGDPTGWAEKYLGWRAGTSLRGGMTRYLEDLRGATPVR